jgi:predicted dehydrogenase
MNRPSRPEIGIGLIGSGFMGRSHALAYRSVAGLFDLPVVPRRVLLADMDSATAEKAARALDFERSTDDWQALVDDPAIGLVDITAPNRLHAPIASAAFNAGKPVYCEKPLAPDAEQAGAMADAAEAAGVTTMVGFNYLKNPIMVLAREIISGGEIGELVSFRGIHAEDYMADPAAPHSWRTDAASGGGALADLGSHIVALARFLMGPIDSVQGRMRTVTQNRPIAAGAAETRPVTVDDHTIALVSFASGAQGTLEASWLAAGRTMQLAFEITGTRGSIVFTQERMNELKLHVADQRRGRRGFTTITAGPDHEPYGAFCPAPGHQLGFNDMKIIEVRDLMTALGNGTAAWPDFREAWRIQCVIDAIAASSATGAWTSVGADGA